MRILVLQHLDVEHPGIFREFWKADGHTWDVVELDVGEKIPPLEGYDLMVVMGGPMDVWQGDILPWLVLEKAAIRRWVKDMGRPYLGICLGHQLLADALGGKVVLMAKPEVGIADVMLTSVGKSDAILTDFPATVETFQWHGAEVSELPEGSEVLAGNTACPIQAFRWGEHAYGFQYHVEITETTVGDWERVPEYKASLEKALGAEGAAELGSIVAARLPAFRASAKRMHTNLFRLLRTSAAGTRSTVST